MRTPVAGSGRRSFLAELQLLIVAVLLPLLGIVAWGIYDRLQHDLAETAAIAGRLARFTATDAERFLRITERLLGAAALHPQVRNVKHRECDGAFAAFAALSPTYHGYVASDLQGQVLCSGHAPGGNRLPEGARAALSPADARSRYWVGDARPGEAPGDWIVPIAYPVRNSDGELIGSIGVRFDAVHFQPIVAAARLPEGTVAGIVDGAGRLLVRSADERNTVGLRFGNSATTAVMRKQGEGVIRAEDSDGSSNFYGFARVAGTDWVAFAAMPAGPAYATVRARALGAGLTALTVIALAIAFATLLGRRILRPVIHSARAARRAAAGDLAVRLPEEGPAETAIVAMQFNRMIETLAAERQSLRESQARYRSLVDLSADWYWEQNAEHRFTKIEGNAFRAAAIYKDGIGKRRWEIPGYAPMEGNWEDHKALIARRESFFGLVFRQTTPAGEAHYLRISGTPTYDATGGFVGYHGVASNITVEMSSRLALQESERKYRDIFDRNLSIKLLVEPGSGRIVDASDAACVFFGHSRVALTHLRFADIGLRPRQGGGDGLERMCADARGSHEFVLRRAGEESIQLEAFPGPVEAAGRNLLYITFNDITARRRAEGELLKLARAVEQSPAAVIITDAAGNIEYVNPRCEDTTGYAREEVLGRNPRLFQSGLMPVETYRQLWRAITAGGEWRGELCNRKKDGELYWEHASISAVMDEEGHVAHFVAVKENITERKRKEAEIRELNESLERRVAERTADLERTNRELDAFSYSVSHDLRAPLRAINGFAHMIEENEGATLRGESRALLARLKRNAVRMGELIDDLLRFARAGSDALDLRKVSLDETAAEVVQELQAQHPGVRVELAPLGTVVCDGMLIKQIFANLIGNAFKYSGKQAAPRVEIGANTGQDGQTAFFVRDNGAGFDMKYAQRLFGVFQRLHHENDFPGTGVGLAIVKRIVERHRGRVWAESAPGEGATFHFTLGDAA